MFNCTIINNGNFPMEKDFVTISNIKNHITKIYEVPTVTSFKVKPIRKDTATLLELFKFYLLLCPANLFKLEIEYDFSNIVEDKYGIRLIEINFLENHLQDQIVEINFIPIYQINSKSENKKIRLNQFYKFNAPYGKSTLIFKVGDFEEKLGVIKGK